MTTDIERVAIHEAGHAIAAVAQRRRVRIASVEAQGESLGHVALHQLQSLLSTLSEDGSPLTGRKRNILEREAIIGLAGAVAEDLRFGGVDFGSEHDLQATSRMLQIACGTQDECNAYRDWLVQRARSLLSIHWGAVLAVAKELAGAGRMRGSRLTTLFDEHGYNHIDECTNKRTAFVAGQPPVSELPGLGLNALLSNRVIARLEARLTDDKALRTALVHAILLLQDEEESTVKNYCTFLLTRFRPLVSAFRNGKHSYFGRVEVMRGERPDGSITLFLPIDRVKREIGRE